MIVFDRLLVGGLRFVLEKIAAAVDAELNDERRLHEALLDAQLRLEQGELDRAEFAAIERTIFERLREIRRARGDEAEPVEAGRIAEVEVSVADDR
ncbi:MAG TPA: gas vesicle protein GvpG [Thermodesulfobacteriota bacterium]|nr:gas vesicle protein GvpG [Thermodesulfobacteriota bacterium]